MVDKSNYLRKIQNENTDELLRYYRDTEFRVKAKLRTAILRGNDTVHLSEINRAIEKEIFRLDSLYKRFTVKSLVNAYNTGDDLIRNEILSLQSKNNITEVAFTALPSHSLKIISDNTYKALAQVPTNIGRQSQDFLRRVGLQSTTDVATGIKSVDEVRRDLTRELIQNNFFHVTYSNGRQVSARSYSGMVARTTSAEAFRSGTSDRLNQLGYDLVEILGHTRDPDSPCKPFEGRVLSLNGKTENYQTIESAKLQGLFHANCVHDIGLSEKNFEE